MMFVVAEVVGYTRLTMVGLKARDCMDDCEWCEFVDSCTVVEDGKQRELAVIGLGLLPMWRRFSKRMKNE